MRPSARLTDGARLLALQRGRWWQAPDGPSLDTGAFVALLEYATGQTARTFGKPSARLLRDGARRILGYCTAGETLVVGDDPEDRPGRRSDGGSPLRPGAHRQVRRPGRPGWGRDPPQAVIDSIPRTLPDLL